MEFKVEKEINAYIEKVEALLLEREAENNLMLGILANLKRSDTEGVTLLYGEEEGRVRYATLRTPPHLWILPSVEAIGAGQMRALAHFFSEQELEMPGVIGEDNTVENFVNAWEGLKGSTARLHMKQGIYRLDELEAIPHQQGELVRAEKCDLPLAEKWFHQFGIEVGEEPITWQANSLAEQMIESGNMHLWKVKGTPVSMVNRARTTKHGATINAVFTPDKYKKNGYATQAVWQLSKKLLEEGFQFCSLYTDLSNPSSNSIYKKIGYKWTGSSTVYHFAADPQ